MSASPANHDVTAGAQGVKLGGDTADLVEPARVKQRNLFTYLVLIIFIVALARVLVS